jgi:hypothetical protein
MSETLDLFKAVLGRAALRRALSSLPKGPADHAALTALLTSAGER